MTERVHTMNFDRPSIIKLFPNGEGRVVRLGDFAVTRLTYAPGWRWSTSHTEVIARQWCRHPHRGFVLNGKMAVEFENGSRLVLEPGDAFDLPAGHDQVVIGAEPCVLFEISMRNSSG